MNRPWAGLARDLLDFALPQQCPGCGLPARADVMLCEGCRARIPRLETALCTRCLATGREGPGCRSHPGFQAWAAWVYDERAALVVHALKYGDRPGLAAALGADLARALPPDYRPDLVIEVPLHPARQRERGYNQAAALAEAVAASLATPRLAGAIQRVRPTRAQARLGPGERRRNLAGAFRVVCPARLEGRSVLLVDDVLTTGATLESALGALASAGARGAGLALAWAS